MIKTIFEVAGPFILDTCMELEAKHVGFRPQCHTTGHATVMHSTIIEQAFLLDLLYRRGYTPKYYEEEVIPGQRPLEWMESTKPIRELCLQRILDQPQIGAGYTHVEDYRQVPSPSEAFRCYKKAKLPPEPLTAAGLSLLVGADKDESEYSEQAYPRAPYQNSPETKPMKQLFRLNKKQTAAVKSRLDGLVRGAGIALEMSDAEGDALHRRGEEKQDQHELYVMALKVLGIEIEGHELHEPQGGAKDVNTKDHGRAAATNATVERINAQREDILRAFIAETGLAPSECEQVHQGSRWWVQRRAEPSTTQAATDPAQQVEAQSKALELQAHPASTRPPELTELLILVGPAFGDTDTCTWLGYYKNDEWFGVMAVDGAPPQKQKICSDSVLGWLLRPNLVAA